MIRRADLLDLPGVASMWRAWWDEFPVPYRTRAAILNEQAQLFERIVKGERLGVCLVEPSQGVLLWVAQGGEELHGYGVYVRPQFRGQGLGRGLMNQGLQIAKSMGFKRVLVAPYVSNTLTLDWTVREGWKPLQLVKVKEL